MLQAGRWCFGQSGSALTATLDGTTYFLVEDPQHPVVTPGPRGNPFAGMGNRT